MTDRPASDQLDWSALPSQEELHEIQRLVTHSGISLKQLMDFRNIVLHAAAEKIRKRLNGGE